MNIYKKLCALVLSLSFALSSAVVPTITLGVLTIGLDGSQNSNYVSFTTNETTGVTTAKGFDIQLYCYISRRLGLRPLFLQYANSTAAENAFVAQEVDVIGGGSFSFIEPVDPNSPFPDFEYAWNGVVINAVPAYFLPGTDTLPSTGYWIARASCYYAYGIVLGDTAAGDDIFNCELAYAIQMAVDDSISTGIYACYATNNNANIPITERQVFPLIPDIQDSVELPYGPAENPLYTPPYPNFSILNGFIPAPSSGEDPRFPRCTACSLVPLPVGNCLVSYLQSQATQCTNIPVTVII